MSAKQTKEFIFAFGHENIQAVHPSTLMFTKERHLSNTGDCIVAVATDKSAADLSQTFKDALRKPNAKLTITLEVDGLTEQINAHGSPKLTLNHPTDIVIRKSEFILDRTLAIRANKSSKDLPKNFVEKLRNSRQKINITLVVHT